MTAVRSEIRSTASSAEPGASFGGWIRLPTVRALHIRTPSPRHFAWLLWLALLLPLAQASATWHVLSHAMAQANGATDEQPALHPTHCDLCLSAAALSGGALSGAPQALPHLAMRHALPQSDSSSVWFAPAVRAYESRAPPFSRH